MNNGTNSTCGSNDNTTESGLDTGILPENHVYAAIFLIAAIAIVSGNVLVIIVYYQKESLRTLSNFLVMQLVYGDLSLVAGIIYHVFTLYIPNLDSNSLFCVTKYAVLFFPANVTNLLLVLLSIDRWLTIVRPFQHDSIMTSRVVYCAVASCWVTAMILTGVCPIVFKLHTRITKPEVCAMIIGVTPEYLSYIGLPFLVTCMLAIAIIYIRIYFIVRQKRAMMQGIVLTVVPHGDHSDNHATHTQNEVGVITKKKLVKQGVKTFKTLGIILGSFIGCWSPFVLSLVIELILQLPADHLFGIIRGLLGLTALLNAITNPFIYAKKMADFRAEFRKLLCHRNGIEPSQTGTRSDILTTQGPV